MRYDRDTGRRLLADPEPASGAVSSLSQSWPSGTVKATSLLECRECGERSSGGYGMVSWRSRHRESGRSSRFDPPFPSFAVGARVELAVQ
jgi:hypothetical protein